MATGTVRASGHPSRRRAEARLLRMRSEFVAEVFFIASPSRHGADNLDGVAVAQGGDGPCGAAHHGAVERDRKAARLGYFQFGGLVAPQFGEIDRLAIARFSVDGELHMDVPPSYAGSRWPAASPNRSNPNGCATAGKAPSAI